MPSRTTRRWSQQLACTHTDMPVVAQIIEQPQERRKVDIAGAWLVAAGRICKLHVSGERHQFACRPFKQKGTINTFRHCIMIQVELELDVGAVDVHLR